MANYTSVTASNICDAAGNKLASGTVSFQATDAANQPLNFQVGGGGQVVTTPATAAITAGVIAGGFQVADSANTSPAGILYRITITDTTLNRVVVTYSLVAVTGTTFNLDNFSQTGAAVLPPVGGSVNGPLTVAGNLNVTGSLGTVTLKTLNGARFADQFGSLQAAYNDLPSTGGLVIVPHGYTETLTANLTLNKPNSGFLFLGHAVITMGTNQVIVTAGTHGVYIDGTVAFGGSNVDQGAVFNYSGTGSAILVGGSSATTRAFRISNILINLSTGANTGISLLNVVYFKLDCPSVFGQQVAGSIGILTDGTGNFTGTGIIINPLIAFVGTCISCVNAGTNAVTILGGTLQPNTPATAPPNGGGIALDFQYAESNFVYGTDIESAAIAIKFGMNATNNYVDFRSESNTNDVTALSGASFNIVRGRRQFSQGSALVVSDAGTSNHFYRPTDGDFDTITNESGIVSKVAASSAVITANAASTAAKFIQLASTGHSGFYYGIESSVGGGFFSNSNAYEAVLYSPTNNLLIRTPLARFFAAISVGGGTSLARYARYTPTLSPAAVAANTTAEQTFAGVLTSGDFVIGVSKPTAQAGLGIVGWRANGTSLCITFSNNTGSPITPTASEVYQVVGVQ